MILAFKPQFLPAILTGQKIHTIREDSTDRWKSLTKIHFAAGGRTKFYNQFKEGVCISTQQIEIISKSEYLNETIVKIDGRHLSQKEVQQLAWNDGFDNLINFWMWFSDGFQGKIIHWTDFKY